MKNSAQIKKPTHMALAQLLQPLADEMGLVWCPHGRLSMSQGAHRLWFLNCWKLIL
jgi:hypothetical protein